MSKTTVAILVMIGISTTIMIYKAETSYAHLSAYYKWMRAFGYALAPWVIGLLVAVLKEIWFRLRKQQHHFSKSLAWAAGVCIIILLASVVVSAVKDNQKQQARSDAMLLLGAAYAPSSIAGYCHQHVEENTDFIKAAQAWNLRHDEDLQKIIAAIKALGGISESTKKALNNSALRAIELELETIDDRKNYCRNFARLLNEGGLDLHRREDTADAMRRIREFSSKNR